jgi:hypothetical protein
MAENLSPDEQEVLNAYRELKKKGHGDLSMQSGDSGAEISVKKGNLVKVWKTEKVDLDKTRLKEV